MKNLQRCNHQLSQTGYVCVIKDSNSGEQADRPDSNSGGDPLRNETVSKRANKRPPPPPKSSVEAKNTKKSKEETRLTGLNQITTTMEESSHVVGFKDSNSVKIVPNVLSDKNCRHLS
jgi:hypothetical protein